MKYFSYDLIAKANEWTTEDPAVQSAASQELNLQTEAYYQELDELRGRVPESAWKFFRYGYAETGLHDGRLVSMNIGDNVPGRRINGAVGTGASVVFLSFGERFLYSFGLESVISCNANLGIDSTLADRNLGDLYTYELTREKDHWLRINFLFATGSEIEITFERLKFKRTKFAKSGNKLENRKLR